MKIYRIAGKIVQTFHVLDLNGNILSTQTSGRKRTQSMAKIITLNNQNETYQNS